MIEKTHGEKLFLQIDGFGDENIKHVFSSKIGWEQDNIYKGIQEIFNVRDDSIYRTKQVHGTDVLIIDDTSSKQTRREEADALITNKKNIVLSTYHADCSPIYFYDKEQMIIAVAHSGWRGTLNNISKEVIKSMVDTFNASTKDIQVGIGPTICKKCYEVKEDLKIPFIKKFGQKVIIKRDNKYFLDLYKSNEINLIKEGILEKNIISSQYCTSCNNDKLFSYRKEKSRMFSMVTGIMILD